MIRDTNSLCDSGILKNKKKIALLQTNNKSVTRIHKYVFSVETSAVGS